MPAPFFPDVVTLAAATAKRTELALSVIRLFQEGFVPSTATTTVELIAAEADFDDYLEQEITAWLAPTKNIVSGYEITAPTEQFLCTTVQAVPNSIAGYWIETAAGVLVLVRLFDSVVPMAQPGNSIKVTPTYRFPSGQ